VEAVYEVLNILAIQQKVEIRLAKRSSNLTETPTPVIERILPREVQVPEARFLHPFTMHNVLETVTAHDNKRGAALLAASAKRPKPCVA
jgi:hypothetical protein